MLFSSFHFFTHNSSFSLTSKSCNHAFTLNNTNNNIISFFYYIACVLYQINFDLCFVVTILNTFFCSTMRSEYSHCCTAAAMCNNLCHYHGEPWQENDWPMELSVGIGLTSGLLRFRRQLSMGRLIILSKRLTSLTFGIALNGQDWIEIV